MILQYNETGDYLGVYLGSMMYWWIFIFVWLIIGILLAVWVYKDAKRRKMEAALWLLIVLLTGIIGLAIYLIVRK